MKNNLIKKIINLIIPIEGFILVVNSFNKMKQYLLTLLIPLLIFYGVVYIGLICFSFIFWKLPLKQLPIPFIEPIINIMVDRTLLLVGFILSLLSYINDNQK